MSEGGKSVELGGVEESVSSRVYSSVNMEMSWLWSKESESEDGMVVTAPWWKMRSRDRTNDVMAHSRPAFHNPKSM